MTCRHLASWLVVGCVILQGQALITKIDLGGLWNITNGNKSVQITGDVPGTVYPALMKAGVIGDPYYRDNDVRYRWIAYDDWMYSRTFHLSSEVLGRRTLLLVCEGLDTVSTVYVNGLPVGFTDNMHRRYTFDLAGMAKEGENTVFVSFQSAVRVAAERAKQSPYVIPPECPPPAQHGECHVNMIRKSCTSFAVDCSPAFPTQGIWKNISILAYDSAVIHTVSVLSDLDTSGSWKLRAEAFLDCPLDNKGVTGSLAVQIPALGVSTSQNVSLTPSSCSASININVIQKVILWWPRGYGGQYLYDTHIKFTSDGSKESSQGSIRIGFRTVELVQNPVSSNSSFGRTFYFRINGVPVYLKGTNWFPADTFMERVMRTKVFRLLSSAALVNVNAMRVWGGTVYAADYFYEIADELGLLLMNDLQFSVALYPSAPWFLSSVVEELRDQLPRLKHHPSIIVWTGNNENEKGLRFNWYNTASHFQQYLQDYVALYIKTIMPIVQEADPTRPFLPSSPGNGEESLLEGGVAQDPSSELYGDIHYYEYVADLWNASNFRIPRMATEYGIQSWCSMSSLADVFAEEDFDYWSDMVEHRNHHPLGNLQMVFEIMRHLDLPNSKNRKQRFHDFIYVTQINQAMSVRMETEHYRRWQSTLGSDGRGLTMASLYWQLNDIWQAPTWSSIDFSGKWKMLHYFARHFLSPLLVSPFIERGLLKVFVVVDEILSMEKLDPEGHPVGFVPVGTSNLTELAGKAARVSSGNLTLQMFSWDSFRPLKNWTVPYKLNSTAELVYYRKVDDLLTESGCPDLTYCFLTMTANSAMLQSSSWLSLSEINTAMGIHNATVKVMGVKQLSGLEFSVSLSSDYPALFVWLDVGTVGGRFSDNGFLMSTPMVTVMFYAWNAVDVSMLRSSLTVISLMNIYHEPL